MLKQIGQASGEMILREVNDALTSIGKKYGLANFRAINCAYTPASIQFRVNASIADLNSEASIRRQTLLSHAVGFDTNVVGRHIYHKDKKFTIIDIQPKKRRYPLIAESSDGTRVGFSRTIKLVPLTVHS